MIKGLILFRMIAIGTFYTALVGCASVTPAPTAAIPATPSLTPAAAQLSWESRQLALTHLQHWQLNGKIAVQTPKDSGSATISWAQSNQHYAISLLGPLGSNGMKLAGGSGQVTLQTSDGKTYHANSGEQLLAERWGYHLPVSNLKYWVRGIPAPGAANTKLDANGRLSSISQQGWQVDYLSYARQGKFDLPERMAISSPALKVKLVVYQWRVG